jgi:hypothetical protein
MRTVGYVHCEPAWEYHSPSYREQRNAIRRYARKHDLRLGRTFRDDAMPGDQVFSRRKHLARLLHEHRQDPIGVVLVERPERLCDDAVGLEVLLGYLRSLGIRVVEILSGTDLIPSQPEVTGRLPVRQGRKALQRWKTALRILKQRVTRLGTERAAGRKCFGTWPGEEDTLQRMIALSRKPHKGRRLSFQRVADALNSEGRPTRGGGPWKGPTVRGILIARRPDLARRDSRRRLPERGQSPHDHFQ